MLTYSIPLLNLSMICIASCKGAVAIETMNEIPVDVAVLGNHEFDYGDGPLIERLNESNSIWLGSNVYYPRDQGCGGFQQELPPLNNSEKATNYFPSVHGNGKVYELQPNLKLGLFGLVTKQTPKISSPSDNCVFDEDILKCSRRTVELLRSRGAQVIVAITHLSEAEDRLLAADRLSGIDLILGGHEHEPLATMIHRGDEDVGSPLGVGDEDSKVNEHVNEGGILCFKCGMNGYWVGEVNLDIAFEDDGVKSIYTSWTMHAVTSRIPEDQHVKDVVKKWRAQTELDAMRESFGDEVASGLSLDQALSTLPTGLDTRMSSVRRRESTGSNMVADAMLWFLSSSIHEPKLPMIAMINGGFIRGDRIYKSNFNFTVRDVLRELPFPRHMRVLKIRGKYLKAALCQQLRGSTKGPTGSYPHLSSNSRMRYTISGSDECISILQFKVDGQEVSNDQMFLVALTCFVAEGNECCTSWLEGQQLEGSWNECRLSLVLLRYLQDHSSVTASIEGRLEKE